MISLVNTTRLFNDDDDNVMDELSSSIPNGGTPVIVTVTSPKDSYSR
jgi:hypothetical protein